MSEKLYVVRVYNQNRWTDVNQPQTLIEAARFWNKLTAKGTKHTEPHHGIYYEVFAVDSDTTKN